MEGQSIAELPQQLLIFAKLDWYSYKIHTHKIRAESERLRDKRWDTEATIQIYIYVEFTEREVRMGKNCARGLEGSPI